MATTLHDAPIASVQPERKPSTAAGSATNAIVDAWLTIIMSLPVACRAMVVLVALAGGTVFLYGKYWPRPPAEPQAPAILQTRLESPGTYTNGRPDPRHAGSDSNNPQNKEADHKAAEDAEAYKWHFNHQSEDNPPEMAIGSDTDEQNYIHYRFFEKSDRCVFVKRRADGNDLTQWVRDPKHHKHDFDSHGHTAEARDMSAPSLASTFLLDSFAPVLSAASLPATPVAEGGGSGNCVNPHPGEFRYWWGTPTDKCNSPMYRQFQDGCVHYQIYNRCANAWDARIFWTTCQAGPHR
jgi:hypothetical protein